MLQHPEPTSDGLACAHARAKRWTVVLCGGLLVLFVVLAWSAISGKSPTMDEPYHALAGWLHLWRGDFRLDSEDPPLWNTLAAALAGPHGIHVDMGATDWSLLPMDMSLESTFEIKSLFQSGGKEATALITRCRAEMLVAGVALGALLAWFTWKIALAGGAAPAAAGAAAVFATGLFALDPNFLAHAPLVKNDVASALALLGLTAGTWAAGRVLTVGRALGLGIWSAIAVTVKFNGPLLVGASAALLVLRALLPWPWPVGLRVARATARVRRLERLLAAVATVLTMAVMSFAAIWVAYGLRFAPAPEQGAQMDMPRVVLACLEANWQAQHEGEADVTRPSDQAIVEMPWPSIVRVVAWAEGRHLLPQAFLAGVLYFYQSVQLRPTFFCGQISRLGRWCYFPFAMAVKTPLATLVTFAAAIIAVMCFANRKRSAAELDPTVLQIKTWTRLCLALPVALYLAAAMSSNLNLGLRHVLPVYPPLFAGCGVVVSAVWTQFRAWALAAGLVVIGALAIESGCAYPNYIPFFNLLAGGSSGGLRLLSDSNLDWGQDLPLLAEWQRRHPTANLYLAYFGNADPAYYGIRYTNLYTGYLPGPPRQPLSGAGILAISATTLQGPYNGQYWSRIWKQKPFEILGGSIYLFHFPPTSEDRLPTGASLIN